MIKTDFDDGIPAFLRRKRSKKDLASAGEYIVPKERVIVTNYGKPKVIVVKEKELPQKKGWRPSIQEAIREKHSHLIGEVEHLLDIGLPKDFSFFKYLTKIQATPMLAKEIAEKYAPQALEINEAIGGKDPDLNEGYGYLTKKELNLLFDQLVGIIEDCQKYSSVNKTIRKARKKKPISKEKLLKTFKFLEKDDTFQIASIDPGKIIGAQELWTFNVKYKQLTVYRALDRAGLTVKGSSIVNYDEKTSICKTIGRKTPERLEEVLKGGKILLKKIMDSIPGKNIPPPRVGKSTILLKMVL